MSIRFFSTTLATPGTPQRLISATNPAQATVQSLGVTSTATATAASTVILQAAPANTSATNIYVGGPGMSVATKSGIGLVLAPGAIATLAFARGETNLGEVYFDSDAPSTDTNTEALFVTLIG